MTIEEEINAEVERWFNEMHERLFADFPKGWVCIQTGETF